MYDYHDGCLEEQAELCFHCWNHGKPCGNCISQLAVQQHRQAVKLETLDRSIFLIVATPFLAEGRTFALEFIKDVTDDLLVTDIDGGDSITAVELVDRINELTVRHPLTGLLRKEYAERELDKLVREWDQRTSIVLAVLDIDRFKQVNDEHGHLAGDGVLAKLSHLLTAYAQRGGGWGSRIGGDEFVLAFPDLPKDKAQELVDALLTEFARSQFKGNEPFSVTASCGLAVLDDSHRNWQDLFTQADRAMYAAKQAKRNSSEG